MYGRGEQLHAAGKAGKRESGKPKGEPLTLERLEAVACGRFDIGYSEFWAMSLRSVIGIIEERELAAREPWERARWLAAALLQPHAKKGTTLKPTDLLKLSWDNENKSKGQEMNEQERQAMFARWDKQVAEEYEMKKRGEIPKNKKVIW